VLSDAAYRGSHTGMEIELATLGITFKHGKPYHPQTQGKVERFHLTLKKWLAKKPPAATLAKLQAQIDPFVFIYNEERPHTARGCPPMEAWRALDKAVIETGSRCWPTLGCAGTAWTRRAASPCAIDPGSTTSPSDERTRAGAS
jgi:Integrase core domain